MRFCVHVHRVSSYWFFRNAEEVSVAVGVQDRFPQLGNKAYCIIFNRNHCTVSYGVVYHRTVSYINTLYHIVPSYTVSFCMSYRIVCNRTTSYRDIFYHIALYSIVSYHCSVSCRMIILYHTASNVIISELGLHCVISYRILSCHNVLYIIVM